MAAEETLPTCSACGAPVRWVLTLGDRRMPLDPEPHEDGNVVRRTTKEGAVRAKVLTGEELPAQETAWRSHFVTCPQADTFRRRKALSRKKCRGCTYPLDKALADAGEVYHPTCAPTDVREHAARARDLAATTPTRPTDDPYTDTDTGQEALPL